MTIALYLLAAVAEIAGCFAFWAWLRLDRSPLWLVPGVAGLCLFAFLLTRVDAVLAGRLCGLWRGLYRCEPRLALDGGRRAARSVGFAGSRRVPDGCGDHPVGAARGVKPA